MAHAIEVAASSIARWEQGTSTPLARYRRPLADRLEVTLVELEQLFGLNGAAAGALNGHAVPPWLDHYASLEQGAARLETFEPLTIPGLLQTHDYAAAVMRTFHLPVSEDGVSERVGARMARQAVLEREPEPLHLVCVIDEQVLHRVTGSPDVMAAQLQHLCEMAARPTIELQVIPADGSALHCAAFGSFQLFTSAGAMRPFIVCTEDLTGFNYQDRPQPIEAHSLLFEHLTKVALSSTESADLIHTTAEHYQ